MLIGILLYVVLLSGIMLNLIMLSVIILDVFMLSVIVPLINAYSININFCLYIPPKS